MPKPLRLLTKVGAAKALGVSRATVYSWLYQHKLDWANTDPPEQFVCADSVDRMIERRASQAEAPPD